MAGKLLFSQIILIIITFASLLHHNGVLSNSLHHTIPHMCEAADDSSEECNRSYARSEISDNALLLASKNITIKYTLYSGLRQPQKFTSDNFLTEIKKLIVLPGAQWKVLIPCFLNKGFLNFPENVRDAYLRNMEKNSSATYNVLVVDWGEGTCDSNLYQNAFKPVQFVGKELGHLLSKLHAKKMLDVSTDVHLIGHGLGSYIAQRAATQTPKDVWRISALDPVGPLFWKNSLFAGKMTPYKRFSTLAKYLDAYHTSTMFGESVDDRVGDVDFYIDGGKEQPNCKLDLFGFNVTPSLQITNKLIQVCSHNYATEIFANSIGDNSMKACARCDSYWEYENNKCNCEDGPVLGESVVDKSLNRFPVTYGKAFIKTKRDASIGRNYVKTKHKIILSVLWNGWKGLCF